MRRFIIALCLVALALLGVKRLILEIPWDWPHNVMAAAFAAVPAWLKFSFWAGAILVPVGLAVHGFMTRGSRRVLQLEGRDKSTLVLRQFVVERLIRETLSELSEVDKVRVNATRTARGLRVEIGLKAKGVFSLNDLENTIRARSEESLRRILGIEKIESIRIRLDDMSASPRVRIENEPRPEAPLPPPRAPLVDLPKASTPSEEWGKCGFEPAVPFQPLTGPPGADEGGKAPGTSSADATQPLEEQPRDTENR